MKRLSAFVNRDFRQTSTAYRVLPIKENCKSSNMGHAKNFWIYSCYEILTKLGKSKNSKKEIIGTFSSGITFDNQEQSFVWYNKFSNENKLDPQIDERCMNAIMRYSEEEREYFFKIVQSEKFHDIYFSNQILDKNFAKDFEAPLNEMLKVLYTSISESEKFLEYHGKTAVNRVNLFAGKDAA